METRRERKGIVEHERRKIVTRRLGQEDRWRRELGIQEGKAGYTHHQGNTREKRD